MSAAAAPSALRAVRPRLSWLTLALLVAAVVGWGGVVSTERQSVQAAADTTQAVHVASAAGIASSRALEAHQKVTLDVIEARSDHASALATLVPLEARLKRAQDAAQRTLIGAAGREDKLMYGRRFALERLRDHLMAWSAVFAAAAVATGVAGLRPWPLRWGGYALAVIVLAWGGLATAARVWDRIG